MGDAEAIEQIPDRRQYRQQHPEPVDPAMQRLPEIGLENRPIGQPALDLRLFDRSQGFHGVSPQSVTSGQSDSCFFLATSHWPLATTLCRFAFTLISSGEAARFFFLH